MHHSRIAVITGLASVDIIIRMNRFVPKCTPKNLDGSIGNNFIRVHVRLGSGSSLPDDQWEMIIEFSLNQLVSCFDNGISYHMIFLYIFWG